MEFYKTLFITLTARESFSKVLRDLRLGKNISQEKLSEEAGLSMRTISLIECDKVQPTISTIEALSKALDVKMSEMVIWLWRSVLNQIYEYQKRLIYCDFENILAILIIKHLSRCTDVFKTEKDKDATRIAMDIIKNPIADTKKLTASISLVIELW